MVRLLTFLFFFGGGGGGSHARAQLGRFAQMF